MTKLGKRSVQLLVGTSKGGFIFRSDARRKKWAIEGPLFKGQIIHHFTLDSRDEGREWHLLADFLPPVYSVEAFGPFN
jgi:hypothetical protein